MWVHTAVERMRKRAASGYARSNACRRLRVCGQSAMIMEYYKQGRPELACFHIEGLLSQNFPRLVLMGKCSPELLPTMRHLQQACCSGPLTPDRLEYDPRWAQQT